MSNTTALDPDAAQRAAAEPLASVWVAASAGSGKTKVLTDRVLTLLLSGTPANRILCLTFTKAAASEMSNRVGRELALWTVTNDQELADRLSKLLGTFPDARLIRIARRLFAQVLDTPGGLKIQTIHGFCESLLARFPIESGVTPQTQVMDERSAAELMRTARDAVLMASKTQPALSEALEEVTSHLQEEQFTEVMSVLLRDRGRLADLIHHNGGLLGAEDAVFTKIGISRHATIEKTTRLTCSDAAFNGDALRGAAAALAQGTGKTDQARANVVARWLNATTEDRIAQINDYLDAFLRKSDRQPRANLATKSVLKAVPGIDDALQQEATRLANHCDTIRAIASSHGTVALLRLGAAMLEAYNAAKRAEMLLDYDDLIYRTRDLLAGKDMTPWVLFKLDGGLDHILIDESQDTNPEQWEIVRAIADEFFAGDGARDRDQRTIFAVGDRKQSIFSFQRADPSVGEQLRQYFTERAVATGRDWRTVSLDTSFRSTEAVLAAVDAVFAEEPARTGVVAEGETLCHNLHRRGAPGRVEVWPLSAPADPISLAPWTPPLRRRPADDPESHLANVLAGTIGSWIGRKTLASQGRRIRAGDILILVRRRRRFVDRLVRALKELNLPVAGVDRLILTDQLAVMDLVVLGRFLLLPEDDLNLATVLKGPLVGLNDEDLFRLAYDRGNRSLWSCLVAAASDNARIANVWNWLSTLLTRVDFTPPYELFADILTQPSVTVSSGRRAMIARLGAEAEDPIDEFLNLALTYERTTVPSLEGFLHWFGAEDTEVKRDLEQSDRDEVRIMTVHGAKGLQAPIVILADTVSAPGGSGSRPTIHWWDGVPIWAPRRSMEAPIARKARESALARELEEYHRLLYVALTRAEDRLYICGARGRSDPPSDCWYNLILNGITKIGECAEFDFSSVSPEGWKGKGYVLSSGPDLASDSAISRNESSSGRNPLPDWALRSAPVEPAHGLSLTLPSAKEPPLQSPILHGRTNPFRRGLLVHRLLELLPETEPNQRRDVCHTFLSHPANDLDNSSVGDLVSEVMNILEHSDFEPIFGENSRAEVALTGKVEIAGSVEWISGQVDRLVVSEKNVLVVDFKTMRPVPPTADAAPEAYLRQLAIYRLLLRNIWPDKRFRGAFLWTEVPILMPIDDGLLDRYTPAS